MGEGGDPGGATTHFGFQTVPEAEKSARVRAVFDTVATRYDLMNDLMSGGVHRLWKAALLRMMEPRPGQHLVDIAGGTGDVAFGFLEAAGRAEAGAAATICDINRDMVAVGRDRAFDRGLVNGLRWVVGDAERLPLRDRCADTCTIAFGLRNVTRIPLALAEARRILRPGGRFFCLEFSRVVVPVLDRLYDAYSFTVLPVLGQLVTGDRAAYQYLVESIRRFPDQKTLAGLCADAGLERVRCTNLSGGIAAIHSAWRL
jgi:demethylmenaquinone methyltransferase/2-methoxy-6-polyprenyl-1,4-benzoquinol methylase